MFLCVEWDGAAACAGPESLESLASPDPRLLRAVFEGDTSTGRHELPEQTVLMDALRSLGPGWDGLRAYARADVSPQHLAPEFACAVVGQMAPTDRTTTRLANDLAAMRAVNAYLLMRESRPHGTRPRVPIVSGAVAIPAREPRKLGPGASLSDGSIVFPRPFAIGWAWILRFDRLVYVSLFGCEQTRQNAVERLMGLIDPRPRATSDALAADIISGVVQGWADGFIAPGDAGDFPSVVRRYVSGLEDDFMERLEGLDPETPKSRPTAEVVRVAPRAVSGLCRELTNIDEALARTGHILTDRHWTTSRSEVEQLLKRARTAIHPLSGEARASLSSMADASVVHQAVVVEQQRELAIAAQEAADEAAARTRTFERSITVVGALVLVPGLIAAFFGANVSVPGRDTLRGTGVLVGSMVSGALITLFVATLSFSELTYRRLLGLTLLGLFAAAFAVAALVLAAA